MSEMHGELYSITAMPTQPLAGGLEKKAAKLSLSSEKKKKRIGLPRTAEKAIASLTPEDIMIIRNVHDPTLKYNHSWARYKSDIKSKLRSRPYIFKLFNRMEQDLDRIERIERMEQKFGMRFYDPRANYRR